MSNPININQDVINLYEQVAVNRYTWCNIPCNITGQELERLIYYKEQLGFFDNKHKEDKE